MKKLMPYLEQWESTNQLTAECKKTIEEKLFPKPEIKSKNLLPSVKEICGDIRNPVVTRCLTQLRQVINAIIKDFGKPDIIRIELAREAKKSSKERIKITSDNEKREKLRDDIRKKINTEFNMQIDKKKGSKEIERYLLWKECGEKCPYTGKVIAANELFMQSVQVEHIYPFSKTLDDSFYNKTLCFHEANQEKGNKTPWQAFKNKNLKEMIERVSKWPKEKDSKLSKLYRDTEDEKLKRFEYEGELSIEGFINRQLNDTQYSSKLACQYVSCLYSQQEKSKVQVTKGTVTALLRKLVYLENRICRNEVGEKVRDDHRHHTYDAFMIGLSSPKMLNRLSRAAEDANQAGKRPYKYIIKQLESIKPMLESSLEEALISFGHRNRIRGSMHNEMPYGLRKIDNGEFLVQRTSIEKITEELKKEKKKERYLLDINLENSITSADQEADIIAPSGNVIKKTSVFKRNKVENSVIVTRGQQNAYFENGENHHAEVWASNEGKWDLRVMSMMDAIKRKEKGGKIYKTLGQNNETFIMNLHNGDVIELHDDKSGLWKIESIASGGQIVLKRVFDSRTLTVSEKDKKVNSVFKPRSHGLQAYKAKRIYFDVLGRRLKKD